MDKIQIGCVLYTECSFYNYLDQLANLTESFRYPIMRNKITFKQILPIALNVSKSDSNLLTAPRNLKDFIQQYKHKKNF